MNELRVIDGHVHMFHNEALASKIMAVFNHKYSVPFSNTGKGTPVDLYERMNKNGIKYSIIANFSSPKHLDANNRWTLSCAAENSAFIPLISFHPEMPQLSTALLDEYCQLGAKGIKLHPMAQDFDPLDVRLFTYYEYAGKKSLPVVFHCGRIANSRINNYSDTDRIIPVIEKFPGTVFVLTHMVDGSEEDVMHIALKYKNVYFDTSIVVSGYELLLEHNIPSWRDDNKCIRVFRHAGTERFLFGSDYPWGDPGKDLQRLIAMDLTDNEKRQICGKNAALLFKIPLDNESV